jgi:hypothetical protein
MTNSLDSVTNVLLEIENFLVYKTNSLTLTNWNNAKTERGIRHSKLRY